MNNKNRWYYTIEGVLIKYANFEPDNNFDISDFTTPSFLGTNTPIYPNTTIGETYA